MHLDFFFIEDSKFFFLECPYEQAQGWPNPLFRIRIRPTSHFIFLFSFPCGPSLCLRALQFVAGDARAGTWTVPFLGGPRHDHLARPKAPCRHDTNTRAVSCLESQHDGLYGTTRILGRAWASTARKQPIGHYVAPCSIMTVNLPF